MEEELQSSVPPRVRLLAVMVADAVSYSRLMSTDDQGTLRLLDAARDVFSNEVVRHSGRVIDMAGDSILAVFENATAAVEAALAVQRRLEGPLGTPAPQDRLRFRIGVHLGDVIEKVDGSVYGDGVNIAARLEGLAAPGGVTVSESIRITVKGRLKATFEDQGAQPAKNIAEPIRAYRVLPNVAPQTSEKSPKPSQTAVAAESWREVSALDAEPGIAVLPLKTLGNAQHTFLADGLAEDIIGLLAAVPGLIVIARSSTFTYRDQSIDARTVGRELGVRYVLEGTLRVLTNRIRLNVSLIDCQSGASLWSDRFDALTEDLLTVQDEITARIINSIRITVSRSEARISRKLSPESLSAWQLRTQAIDLFYRWSRSEMLEAIALNRRAIELAPNEAEGHANLAVFLWAAAVSDWAPSGAAAIDEALDLATRSINLDEGLCRGHVALSLVLIGLRRHDEAISAAERAYELAPGDFSANSSLGQALAYAGHYDAALLCFDRALRLSPKDPLSYSVYQARSIALFGLARYEEVVASAQRVSRSVPEWVEAHVLLASGFMGLGNSEQATKAVSNALKLNPRLTVKRAMRRHPLSNPEDTTRLARFLRAAGLPES